MIKKAVTILLCMGLGSALYAENVTSGEKFIGLEVGAAELQADTDGGFFGEPEHESTGAEFGLRVGAQNNEWRTTLIFDYYDNTDDDQNYEKGLVAIDYFLLASTESIDERFKPYLGVNVGYMNYESTNIDENGLLYGGQGGISFDVAENFEIDIGYRYSLCDAERTDHIGSAVFGINYIY
jgi:opacity protein-like surface antigen